MASTTPCGVAVGPAVSSAAAGSATTGRLPFFFLRFRLLRPGKPSAFCSESGIDSPSDAAETSKSVEFSTDSSAVGLDAAANSGTRATPRPRSLRRSRRGSNASGFLCVSVAAAATTASGPSISSAAAASKAISDAGNWLSSISISATSRSACLRAVRLAPPRERRFFFPPVSNAALSAAFSAASGAPAVASIAEATGTKSSVAKSVRKGCWANSSASAKLAA